MSAETNYSQWGEQEHITRFFTGFTGRFLDIGAGDGITGSNTYALALAGWAGLCVEPDPVQVKPLLDLYRSRPDVEILHAAIIAKGTKPVDFWGLVGQRSTTVDKMKFGSCRKFYVGGFDAHAVAASFGAAWDFVSLDVEGAESSVLESLHELLAATKLLCVEDVQRLTDKSETRTRKILTAMGFTKLVARTVDTNSVYSNWLVTRSPV